MLQLRSMACAIIFLTMLSQSALALDARSIFKGAQESVVVVRTYDGKGKEISLGSGFFVFDGKTIITNYHLVKDALKIKVEFKFSGATITQEITHVLALAPEHDLALLYAPLPGKPLQLANRTPDVGEEVVAIGHPKGLERTLSTGIVSAIREEQGITLYQITTPLAPGSSGGPLIDGRGRVVGVTTAGYTYLQNLNFAVPTTYVDEARRSAKKTSFADARRVARARVKAKRKEGKLIPTEAVSAGAPAPVYKVAVFPFAGWIGHELREQMVRGLHARIKANPSLELVYSAYDSFLNEPRIRKPQRLWAGNAVEKKPALSLIYQIGQERELDAVITYWSGANQTWFANKPTPITIYVIDVDKKHVYRQKGKGKRESVNTVLKKLLGDFVGGRGGARTKTVAAKRASRSTTAANTGKEAARPADAPAPPEGYALLYFYRVHESPRWGKATLSIENERIVRLKKREFTWLHIKQGTYTIQSEWVGSQPDLKFQGTFFKGETYYIKITEQVQSDGTWYRLTSKAKSMDKDDAEPEIVECCEYLRAKTNLIN